MSVCASCVCTSTFFTKFLNLTFTSPEKILVTYALRDDSSSNSQMFRIHFPNVIQPKPFIFTFIYGGLALLNNSHAQLRTLTTLDAEILQGEEILVSGMTIVQQNTSGRRNSVSTPCANLHYLFSNPLFLTDKNMNLPHIYKTPFSAHHTLFPFIRLPPTLTS